MILWITTPAKGKAEAQCSLSSSPPPLAPPRPIELRSLRRSMHIPAFYGLQARTNASRSTFQWGRPVCLRVPGVKPGYAARVKDLMAAGALTPAPPSTGTDELPTNFDATTAFPHCAKVIDDIRDQSACGCCWAFAPAVAPRPTGSASLRTSPCRSLPKTHALASTHLRATAMAAIRQSRGSISPTPGW